MYNITASIILSKDVPQPKSNGVKSGYAPHHKFQNIDYLLSGFHKYKDDVINFPGETLVAQIVFPSWKYVANNINIGDKFEIQEMNRVVGFGFVESIEK